MKWIWRGKNPVQSRSCKAYQCWCMPCRRGGSQPQTCSAALGRRPQPPRAALVSWGRLLEDAPLRFLYCQAARAVCQQFRSQAWSPRKSFYWRHVLMVFLVSLFFKNNCCVLWMNSVEKSATIVTHLPNTLVFYPTSQRTISFTIKGFGTFQ